MASIISTNFPETLRARKALLWRLGRRYFTLTKSFTPWYAQNAGRNIMLTLLLNFPGIQRSVFRNCSILNTMPAISRSAGFFVWTVSLLTRCFLRAADCSLSANKNKEFVRGRHLEVHRTNKNWKNVRGSVAEGRFTNKNGQFVRRGMKNSIWVQAGVKRAYLATDRYRGKGKSSGWCDFEGEMFGY